MNILLDTHIFLWFITKNKRLSDYYYDIIRDEDNEVYISVISLVSRIFRAGPKSKNRALLHKDFRKPKSVVRINKDTNVISIF